jgi:hypothetical protein
MIDLMTLMIDIHPDRLLETIGTISLPIKQRCEATLQEIACLWYCVAG